MAQAPQLTASLPCGAPRASTSTLQLYGVNLQGAHGMISGRGVHILTVSSNAAGDSAAVRLEIAADAPLGSRELRVTTERGASNALRLWVDVFPNLLATSAEHAAQLAQPLPATPVVVNGAIRSSGVQDVYSFTATAGQTWVFDVNAARIRSPLDPVLDLRDAAGKVIETARSQWHSDPRLVHTIRTSGAYMVAIHDAGAEGGPAYVYRLTAGQVAVVDYYLPRGERPGRSVDVQLHGVNLGSTRHAVVNIPLDAQEAYWTTVRTANGPALPFPLAINTLPVVGITETDATMPLPTLPAALDGAFRVYPRIRFFFEGKPGEHLLFDLQGRRFGSQVGGALQITDWDGKRLEEAAESPDLDRDARIEFTPPADALYIVEARNVEIKTGPGCFYRLVAERQQPDFRLRAEQDRVTVAPGGRASLTVSVERLGGFDGPVKLGAAPLPDGLYFSGGSIPAGQSSTQVSVTAPPAAHPGAWPMVVRGSAVIGHKTVVQRAVPQETYTPRPPAGAASPAGATAQRLTDLLPLVVIAVTPRSR